MTSVDRRSERGDSLVEILVALAILGIGITALLGALGTSISTTGVNRSQAHASATLLSAAEFVKSLDSAPCSGGSITVTDSQVPHDQTVFTVTYGPAVAFDSGTPCTTLSRVPVRVQGDGFDVSLDVVKRP